MARTKDPGDPHEYGTGSCFQYKSGWRCDFHFHGRSFSTTGRTPAVAQRRKRDKLRALEAAEQIALAPKPIPVMTVAAWVERWRRSKDSIWSEGTKSNYGVYLDMRILPTLGNLRLDQVTEIGVNEAIAAIPGTYLDKSGHSRNFGSSTRKHTRDLIHGFMSAAVRSRAESGLTANPLDQTDSPWYLAEGTVLDPWTPEQVETFFKHYWGHRLCPAIGLAGFCGMRESEILGLSWSDIDLDRREIRVRIQLRRSGRLDPRLKSKRENTTRKVSIPAHFVPRLAAHKAAQDKARLLAGECWKGDRDLVVTTYLGTPFGHRNLLRDFEHLYLKIGLPHTHIHGLRHAWNSTAKAHGVSAAVRQQMMGHGSLRTTERYDHTYEATIIAVAQATEEIYPWMAALAS
jgi:integrase